MKSKIFYNYLYFLITLLCGFFIIFKDFNFQPQLSQGDHGLCLYASEAVLRGERPYHDFHWFYGPLMPYYYAAFLKIFGVSIKTILIAQKLLMLISGILIYLSVKVFLPLPFSLIAALWFFGINPDFFYTYNHTGGLTASLAVFLMFCYYVKNKKTSYLYYGFIFCALLGLVRINIAISSLTAFILAVLAHDLLFKIKIKSKKSFYLTGLFMPLLLITMNFPFIFGLPFYIIRQGYQYFGNDKLVGNYPGLWVSLKNLWHFYTATVNASLPDFLFNMLLIILLGFLANIILSKKTLPELRNNMFIVIFASAIFFLFNIHEFLLSGVIFRKNWAYPFSVLFVFFIAGFSSAQLRKSISFLLTMVLLLITLISLNNKLTNMNRLKNESRLLEYEKASIYTNNPDIWMNTVKGTIDYLNKNLKHDELFFALPYEPVYYFLTNKKSPTRQLAFFDFVQITCAQEENIIDELNKNNVNWIILSNRYRSSEPGLGIFGKTNCPILARYLIDNFEEKIVFGPWAYQAQWIENHSIKILKRR